MIPRMVLMLAIMFSVSGCIWSKPMLADAPPPPPMVSHEQWKECTGATSKSEWEEMQCSETWPVVF